MTFPLQPPPKKENSVKLGTVSVCTALYFFVFAFLAEFSGQKVAKRDLKKKKTTGKPKIISDAKVKKKFKKNLFFFGEGGGL